MINYLVPLVVIIIIVYGIYKKVDIFDTFLIGVKEGIRTCSNLFPTIFAMVLAISVLTNSNVLGDLCSVFGNLFDKIGFPSEVFPLAILRSISGSSSLALLSDILSKYGPDSFIGRVASVMQGSTDTTIYIIGMYFASVGVKKIKYSLVVGLLADFISVVLSVMMVNIFFN